LADEDEAGTPLLTNLATGSRKPVVVHAKDDSATAFYQRFGLQPSPTDPFRLFLLMKDIKASLGL
jgi:hypothetical protein